MLVVLALHIMVPLTETKQNNITLFAIILQYSVECIPGPHAHGMY